MRWQRQAHLSTSFSPAAARAATSSRPSPWPRSFGRGWRVSFVGVDGGIEERLVGERALPFHGLPAGRSAAADRSGRALRTLAGSAGCGRSADPESAPTSSFGTAATSRCPAVLGARLARRPVLLLEPNAGGVANRWLSRWGAAAAVGSQATIADLEVPLARDRRAGRAASSRFPRSPSAPPAALLVLGGSQGREVTSPRCRGGGASALALPRDPHRPSGRASNVEETRRPYRGRPCRRRFEVVSGIPGRRRRGDGGEPSAGLPRRGHHRRRDLRRRPRLAARAARHRRGIRWTTPGSSPRPAPPR